MQVETSQNLARGGRAAIVVGLHVLVIYTIATSLGFVRPPAIIKPMQAMIIDAAQPQHTEKPVISKPQLDQPQLNVPVPEVEPQVEVPVETVATPPDAAPPTEAISDANLKITRRVDPSYPPASRRAGEQGTAVLAVLVDANGHPQDIKVQTSSGYDRLDQAAVQGVQRWLFNPAVRDAQKVTAWTTVRVTFKLENARPA